jgi:DNA polymerase alpha subunit A
MERTRRNVDGQAGKVQRRSALAELAAARAGGAGARRAATYKPKEEEAVYDVVDEDEYARLVAKRRMEAGDFLEHDGDEDDGDGYADDGADDEMFGGGGGEEEGAGGKGNNNKRKGGANGGLGGAASEVKRQALERQEARDKQANRDRMAQMFARATANQQQQGAKQQRPGSGGAAGPSNAAAGAARPGAGNRRGAAAADNGATDALLADILGEIDDGGAGGGKKPAAASAPLPRRSGGAAAAATASRKPAAAAVPKTLQPAAALMPAPRAIGSVWDTDAAPQEEEEEERGHEDGGDDGNGNKAPATATDDGFTFDAPRAAPAPAIDSQQPPFGGAAAVKAEQQDGAGGAAPTSVKPEPLSPAPRSDGADGDGATATGDKPRRRFADDAPVAATDEAAGTTGWQAMYAAAGPEGEAAAAAAAPALSPGGTVAAAAGSNSTSAVGDLALDPSDGSLPFYFLDAYENPDRPDTLFLFGKVQASSAAVKSEPGQPSPPPQQQHQQSQWISCCAVVPNCHFSLIVVPTADVFADPDGELAALEEKANTTAAAAAKAPPPADDGTPDASAATEARLALLRALHSRAADLKEELRTVMRRHGVRNFRVVPVRRDYAFEQDDVPRGKQWCLKVRIPATEPRLPLGLRGDKFLAVFGTNQSSLEALLVKRGVRGPGWLSLRGALARRDGGAGGGGSASAAASWCRAEVVLEGLGPKGVCPPAAGSPLAQRPAPPLVVASLALRLRTDAATQASEIVSASVLTCSGVPCDAPAPRELWCGAAGGAGGSGGGSSTLRNFSIVRKLDGRPWPPGFEAAVAAENASPRGRLNGGQMVATAPNERALLSLLLARLASVDADVLVGHNIGAFELPLLLQRMATLKVPLWSRVGRLKRNTMPRLTGGGHAFGGGAPPGVVACLAGRLLADTYVSSRELLREVDYTLRTLAKGLLGQDRPELPGGAAPAAMARRFDSADGVAALLRHGEGDAWLALGVLFQLSVLPLAKQLANLSGSLWSRVLQGARAQRIEWLLLHEFHARKFILPDKLSARDKALLAEKAAAQQAQGGGGGGGGAAGGNNNKKKRKAAAGAGSDGGEDDHHDDGAPGHDDHDDEGADQPGGGGAGGGGAGAAAAPTTTKGPQYAGGLVLEPKKGLYDSVVLVLDFNSLYPSIIQEFNICFTTVERPADGGPARLPSAPAADGPGGAASPDAMAPLPAVIQQLVRRRREVKQLMKQCRPNDARDRLRYQQLNIRQQALKLTANSMYGCLGFAHSRFYARPLAELVTLQGREILQATVDLVGGLAAEASSNAGAGGGNDGNGDAPPSFAPLADVIYGDTDSIMVHTGTRDVGAAVRLGERVKREVNRRYRLLEIELDAVFRAMLLLKKKKYAAVKLVPRANGGRGGAPEYDEELEAKGLDIVRRDWCGLAKECGLAVLREVLGVASPAGEAEGGGEANGAAPPPPPPPSSRAVEDSVALVHERLRALRAALDAGDVPLQQLAVVKQLTKRPEDYPDAKNQPHVQVALRRKAQGKRDGTMPGETVPYVVCVRREVVAAKEEGTVKGEEEGEKEAGAAGQGQGQEEEEGAEGKAGESGATTAAASAAASASLPLAMRAYHPDEVRDDPTLAVDVEYYLGQQVLPVVARLLAPLEGLTDAGRLADCLGLSASKYSRGLGGGSGGGGGGGAGGASWWADALREGALNACGGGPLLDDDAHYAECEPLVLRAPNGTAFEFKGVRAHLRQAGAAAVASAGGDAAAVAAALLTPPDAVGDASAALSFAQAGNQALLAARRAVAAYYEGRLRSDDDVAAAETRDVTLAGRPGGGRGGGRAGGNGGDDGADDTGRAAGVICPPGTCLAPAAPGGPTSSAPAFLHRALGEDRLYAQLSYYVRLLDASGALAAAAGAAAGGSGAPAAEQAARRQAAAQALGGPAAVAALDSAARAVAKLRDASGYRWIDMGQLFAAVGGGGKAARVAAAKAAAAGAATPGARRGSVVRA